MVKALHVQRAFQLMERLIKDTWYNEFFYLRKKHSSIWHAKGLFPGSVTRWQVSIMIAVPVSLLIGFSEFEPLNHRR